MAEPKDIYDKAEVIGTIFGALLTPIVLVILGFFVNGWLQKQQQIEEASRLYAQLVTERESSESDLRSNMFKSIVDSVFAATPAEKQFVTLDVLAKNFHESLDLRPLFLYLERLNDLKIAKEISRNDIASQAQLRRLEAIANGISQRQLLFLEKVGETIFFTLAFEDLEGFTDNNLGIPLGEWDRSLGNITRHFRIDAVSVDKLKKRVKLRLWVTETSEKRRKTWWDSLFRDDLTEPSVNSPLLVDEEVDFYKFPMTDNLRLSNDQRIAIVMTEFGALAAQITLVYFPGSYASLKEKPYVEEAIKKLEDRFGR